jgi:hypothetical protein
MPTNTFVVVHTIDPEMCGFLETLCGRKQWDLDDHDAVHYVGVVLPLQENEVACPDCAKRRSRQSALGQKIEPVAAPSLLPTSAPEPIPSSASQAHPDALAPPRIKHEYVVEDPDPSEQAGIFDANGYRIVPVGKYWASGFRIEHVLRSPFQVSVLFVPGENPYFHILVAEGGCTACGKTPADIAKRKDVEILTFTSPKALVAQVGEHVCRKCWRGHD